MDAETLFLRLASSVPASVGAWVCAAAFSRLCRIRNPALRAWLWTWAVLATLVVLVGLPSPGILHLHVTTGPGSQWVGTISAAATLAWTFGAAALVVRRISRSARIRTSAERIADIAAVPDDLAIGVTRVADRVAVDRPRIAACEGDGTAFVTGVRAPVLVVPLGLWRRLDVGGRRAMLLHELSHVRRRDPLRLAAVCLVIDVLWPAFGLRWIASRLREAWEAQADAAALAAGAGRTALATSLVSAWTGPAPDGVLAFGGAAGSIERRLDAMRAPSRAGVLTLQVLVLGLAAPVWPARESGVSFVDDAIHARGVVSVGVTLGGPLLVDAVRRLVDDPQPAEMRNSHP